MYREDPRALGGYQVILMIRFLFCFIFCTVFIFFSSLFFSFFWASFNDITVGTVGILCSFVYLLLSGGSVRHSPICPVLDVQMQPLVCCMCMSAQAHVLCVQRRKEKKEEKKRKKQKPQNPHFSNHPLSPSHPDKNPFRSRTNEGMEAGKCTRERWNCGGKWS